LDEEKSKYPGLAQETSFGSAESLVKVQQGTLRRCRKECTKYYLAAQ
jgi:hypothetical protein